MTRSAERAGIIGISALKSDALSEISVGGLLAMNTFERDNAGREGQMADMIDPRRFQGARNDERNYKGTTRREMACS